MGVHFFFVNGWIRTHDLLHGKQASKYSRNKHGKRAQEHPVGMPLAKVIALVERLRPGATPPRTPTATEQQAKHRHQEAEQGEGQQNGQRRAVVTPVDGPFRADVGQLDRVPVDHLQETWRQGERGGKRVKMKVEK
jgi:hypothetical protein